MNRLTAIVFGEPVQPAKEGAGALILEKLSWYSAHSIPTALAPVGKLFYTTMKIKYAKYKDM